MVGEQMGLFLERADLIVEHPFAAGSIAARPVAAWHLGGVRQLPRHQTVVGDCRSHNQQNVLVDQSAEASGDVSCGTRREAVGVLDDERHRAVDPAGRDRLVDHVSHHAERRALGRPGTVLQHPDQDRFDVTHPHSPSSHPAAGLRASVLSHPRAKGQSRHGGNHQSANGQPLWGAPGYPW